MEALQSMSEQRDVLHEAYVALINGAVAAGRDDLVAELAAEHDAALAALTTGAAPAPAASSLRPRPFRRLSARRSD